MFNVDEWVYGKNRNHVSRIKMHGSSTLPVISGITENNGVNYYTRDYIPPDEVFESELTISTRGEYSGTVFYQDHTFTLANNILVMKMPGLTKNQKMFIGSIISTLGYGGYSGYPKKTTLGRDIIYLPIKDGEPNFDFMESFITDLENRRIAELESYLTVAGLKDYRLTDEEQKALDIIGNEEILAEFSYSDIFNKIAQGRRLKKDDQITGEIPFVMAGTTNNGVVNYISNPVASFPKKSITIDIFGNTFYRNYSFGAGDDTGVYWSDQIEYSKEQMLFFATVMQKSITGKFDFGKKLRSSQSFNLKMQLPIKNNQPDYTLMETLISAVQKLVIKDVVLYTDRKIKGK